MKRDYNAWLSFADVSFNVLICFICLFCLSFILINKKLQEDAKVSSKAEFMITFEWPKECPDDVDAYVEDPLGNIVFFRSREKGLMHLDRDDLGHRNDVITLADGTLYKVDENKEIVTIRGIIPGEYIVNAHMYQKPKNTEWTNKPTTVTVKVEKLNPIVKIVAIKKFELKRVGDEETAFRFTLDKKGYIEKLEYNLPKAIAAKKVGGNTHYEEDYDEEGNYNGE